MNTSAPANPSTFCRFWVKSLIYFRRARTNAASSLSSTFRNPALPDVRIEVFGPPPTSGTRDAFVELAMEGGCKTFAWIKALKKSDKHAYKALCHTIREDGAFIEAGENDNLIVHKLVANPKAFGIFGFGFLDQNADKVQGNPFDAVTTVTVQIVTLLTGDQEFDSAKTLAAFALGFLLFVVTLIMNVAALHIVRKYREQYE